MHVLQLKDLNSSPNIIWVIKSRIMSWAGYVARIEDRKGVYRVSMEYLWGRDHSENTGVDGRKILRLIFS